MNSCWASFCEQLKRCGRHGTLFIFTLAALVALSIVVGIVQATELGPYLLPLLTSVGLLALWRGVVLFRRARHRERTKFSPLSCDELRVARSKLVKDRD
jgi:hypothetical protein